MILIFLMILLLVYGSVVTSDYAFSDDYSVLFDAAVHDLTATSTMLVQGGRPLYAPFNYIFVFMTNLSDYGWIRLFSIIGISALASLIYRHLKTTLEISNTLALTGAIICVLNPAFQVYSAWTIDAPFSWAACLSGLSSMALARNGRNPRIDSIFSYCMLSMSMMVYQPSGMMFWAFAAITMWGAHNTSDMYKFFAKSFCVMALALVTDFLASKALPRILFSNVPSFERSAITHDIYGKLTWFLSEVLPNALRLSSVGDNPLIPMAFIALIVIGIVSKYYKHPLAIPLYIALVPLSYTPNLIVAENWPSYRSQVALCTLMALYIFLSICRLTRGRRFEIQSEKLMVLAVVYLAFLAHRNVQELIVKPQVKELALIEKYLTDYKTASGTILSARSIYFVPAKWEDALVTPMLHDEFGLPSSGQPWAPAGMVWSVLRAKRHPIPAGLTNFKVGPLSQAPSSVDTLIIDMGKAIHTDFK